MDHHTPALLAGLLLREGTQWRVLDDRDRTWRLGSLATGVVRALEQCTGHLTVADLADDLPTALREEFLTLMDDLAAAGVVRPAQHRERIAVIGAGRLALAFCRQLCSLGPSRLLLTDVSAPDLMLYPRSLAPTGASALQQALRSEVGVEHDLVVGGHWAELSPDTVDVAVSATPTAMPDRAITDHLVRSGVPHLVVSQHRQVGHVGPSVLPGRGPCLCCDDIVRAAGDPHWPITVATLSRTPSTCDERLLGWVAQQAALMVTGGLQTAASGRLWSASVTGGVWSRDWLPHPDCPCQVGAGLGATLS